MKLVEGGVVSGEPEATLECMGVRGLNMAQLWGVSPNFLMMEDVGE